MAAITPQAAERPARPSSSATMSGYPAFDRNNRIGGLAHLRSKSTLAGPADHP
jgi:hypothetical protein